MNPTQEKYKFITLNTRGLRDPLKRQKLFNVLGQATFFSLQETHSTKADEESWSKLKSTHYWIMAHSARMTAAEGTALLIDKKFDIQRQKCVDGRLAMVQVQRGDLKLQVIGAYMNNGGCTKNAEINMPTSANKCSTLLNPPLQWSS